jgi:integrase
VLFLVYEYVNHYVKRNRESAKEVIRILNKDVLPQWRDRDARTINAREIIELLDAIVERDAPVMANRTADILAQMFKYGIHRQIVQDSPVKLLYKPGGKEKSKKRVLSETELTAFVQGVGKVSISRKRAHTLRVLLLTLERRGALAVAEWSEFHFAEKEWHVPAEHDKMRRAHIVPLTDWAISELRGLQALAKGSRFVLPKRKGDRPSDPQLISRSVFRLQKRFQAIGIAPFTPHDLRRTGRTELARLGIRKEIGERVLNHSKDIIEGTYDLYEYLPEKRDALEKLERRLRELESRPPAFNPSALAQHKKRRGRRERVGQSTAGKTTAIGSPPRPATAGRRRGSQRTAPDQQQCLELLPVTSASSTTPGD